MVFSTSINIFNIFIDNSLAKFKNLLIEDINLKGEWRVVLTEITIPTHFCNVTPERERESPDSQYFRFRRKRDGTGYLIGHKESSHISSTLTSETLCSNYPVDISAGIQLMFIYLEIIDYQIVDDTKSPSLRFINTNRRVKTVSLVALNQIIANPLATRITNNSL